MSNEHSRDRGKLFENAEKKKPSQPDFHGDCNIDGVAYEIRGWRRDDELTLSLAPPRGDRNTYPPDVFRGSLEAAPPKPVRGGGRGGKGAKAPPPPSDEPPTPAWSGTIESDELAYTVRAFEKQGKSGMYFTLSFERTEKAEQVDEWVDPDPSELDG